VRTRKSTDMSSHADEANPEPHAAPHHAPLEWDTPMYRLAVDQLDQTAEQMNLDPNIWERLRTPQRAHVVSFPFRRDATRRRSSKSSARIATSRHPISEPMSA
jgi:hypothetical protein